MNGKIDKTDFEILRILRDDCRKTFEEIAKEAKIHKNTLINRIKKLEKNKVIVGYTASIDTSKIGHPVLALLLAQVIGAGINIPDFKEALNHPEIVGSGLVTGRYPLMALVNTDSVDDLKRIVGKVAQHKIIRSVKYILLHKQYKSVAEFNPLSDKVNLLSANNNIIKLTDVDHKILGMLTKDCKKPHTEISKELGIQPTTVKTRIEKLTNSGVIMRSNAILDYGKLGFTELACMLIQFDAEHKSQEEKILNKYAKFPEILSLTSLSGEFDVFVIGIFKSKESLAKFLHKLNSIPGIDIMVVEIIYKPLIGPLMNHVKV